MSNIVALKSYLKLFQAFFDLEGVTEICINRPYELWIEQRGNFSNYGVPELSKEYLIKFACLVGEYNHREISPENPILSSVLPDGSRIQFVIEPACEKGSFVCSIRRKSLLKTELDQYFSDGKIIKNHSNSEDELIRWYQAKQYIEFLKLAVLEKKNIIISGGTSTGKTTILNTLVNYIPLNERIITIESDREVTFNHKNSVHLLASQDAKAVSEVSMLDLLKASLRLRPDRILVSEIRSDEAFPYLRAINSGHPGSITTLHADSPAGCFDQLTFMTLQSGVNLTRSEIQDYIKSVVDIVIQIKRDNQGRRYISEIYFKAEKQHQKKFRNLYPVTNNLITA